MQNTPISRATRYFFRLLLSVIAISFVLLSKEVEAGKNYYFSTSTGNDSRTSIEAQNPATPWKTINKLNSYFVSVLPGDSILFKRSEVYYGTIKISNSGTAPAPIIIGAYGTGSKPVVSGFSVLSSWSSMGDGSWKCDASSSKEWLNMVTVDNLQQAIGRFPNTGYLTFESASGGASITDNQLLGTPNWTGAEVVIRKNHWILDRNKITNHAGSTIAYTNGSTYPGLAGFGYFIQNDPKTLDQFGEWYFNPTSKTIQMYFGANNPTSYSAKASFVDTLVYCTGRNYITFHDLSFQGANKYTFLISNSQHITIQYCDINFTGTDAVNANISTYLTVNYCTVGNTNNNGIILSSSCGYSSITNNTLLNTGAIPGMGKCGDMNYQGITCTSSFVLIEKNSITNTGYVGINFKGNSTVVQKNYIKTFCFNKDDGGAIYTGDDAGLPGKKINYNLCIDGIGAKAGTPYSFEGGSHGIYIEGYPNNLQCIGNTIANCTYSGLYLHFTQTTIARDNTLYNNGQQLLMSWDDPVRQPIRTTTVNKNIIFSKNTDQSNFLFNTLGNDIAIFGSSDSNYYCQFLNDAYINTISKIGSKSFHTNYNLAGWKSAYNKDLHSKTFKPFPEYTFNSLIGSNKVTNGTFNSTVTGFNVINSTRTWSNGAGLDAGHIELSAPASLSSATNLSTLSATIGSVSDTKNYIVRFSSIGTAPSTIVGIYLRQNGSPWSELTGKQYVEIKNTRGEHELLFSLPISETIAALYFNYKDDDAKISLDNVQVYEADVSITNVDDFIRFEYNSTDSNKTINLDDTYITVDSTVYNGSVTLLPYASIILIKSTDTSVNHLPTIQNQNFPLNENSPNGLLIGTILASDPDAGQTLTYSILSGNTGAAFAINASSGALSVANSALLNFETTPTFTLVVKVQDNGTGNLSSQASITVSLQNVNEVPSISNQSFSVAENSANGTLVGTVAASDPDAGQVLSYSILSGNTGGAFAINAANGVLTVASSVALNFEANPTFALVVKVQDNGSVNLSSQASITVSLQNVNEAPSISNQSFSVAENSINGTLVGTVAASDPDAGQTKTFSIVSGNTGGAFAIGASTGTLTVADLQALNFEANPSFALVVKVQDNGTVNLSSQASITVSLQNVNEAPSISNQSFSVAENSANGTLVGTVAASDPDAGQTKTFSIVSGNTGGAFAIGASTGTLTVADLQALNFEANPSFALVVKVQDNGTVNLSSQATITVSLQNVNEAPSISNQSFSVAENSANGTLVGTVAASDPDAGQVLSYSILSGNTGGAFAINAANGVLTVASSVALNFEANPTFALVVKVQDNGSVNLSSQASITVSLQNVNEAPSISNQSFSVAENSANGTLVGTVAASDPDAGQVLSYSILSGNTGGAFAINAANGDLTVSSSVALNFEANPTFALVVKVQDNGSVNLSSQASITVSLQNVNEAPSISNQSFSVAENSANGTLVGTVAASDPDAGQVLSYSILSGNTGGAFAINAANGDLAVSSSVALDFEANPTFALVVKVQDNGTVSLNSQASITVSLQNVNEAPSISNQSFSVAENSANGTLVGTVAASDPDAGQVLSYSILSGNTGGAFAINAANGDLTVSSSVALNFVSNPVFVLAVKVQDNGTVALSSQSILTVTLFDINEAPSISNQSFSVAENSANGTLVGTVAASDPDAGQVLSYSILSGNTGGAFAINAANGDLTVSSSVALNFEANPTFALVVKVQDNGTGNLSSQASITVSLQNVNEVPSISNQSFSVAENSANGTLVGTVAASDPDAGQVLSYSILSGNTGGAFAINAANGVLTVASSVALNFEANPTFALIVKVQDNGTVNLSSQASITVSLQNVNEVPSISNQSFSVAENSANGTLVGTVAASDPDAGQVLSYSILSGNTGGAFAINAANGDLTVSSSVALNFEANPTFALVVKVQDNGIGLLSSQANITLNILNVGNCVATGNISYQVWNNIGGGFAVINLTSNANYPNNPSTSNLLTSMEAPTNYSNSFGARIAGYICAPATGSYTFWIAADDNTELWLSTDDQPANKQKIAYHTSWTNPRQWNKFVTQKSVPIYLNQGQAYYIEALMKDGSSGPDNLAVGWLKPGETGSVPSEVIPGSVLAPLGSIQTVLVTLVSLPLTLEINTATSSTIAATVLPGNATNSALSWSSSNTAVATVNSVGLVTGIAAGYTAITATATDGSNMSGTCAVTVGIPPCSAAGNISYQVWNNIGGGFAVINLTSSANYPNNPSSSALLTSMEAPTNYSNSFGARIAGSICAPATGSYTFWIAADDNTELWLSTDDQPANKQKIAYHTSWTNPRQWNKFVTQKSVPIYLNQGQIYYIEALMKDGSSGPDNLSVGWLKPGQTGSVPSEVIPGSVLSPIGAIQTVLVTSVVVPLTLEINTASSSTITATVLPGNSTNSTLSWSSSNSAVATVNSLGLVTGISTGDATITASATDGSNKSGYCTVTVNVPPCSATGSITYQAWNNIGPGMTVVNLTSNANYPNNPSATVLLTSMEAPTNYSNSFGARIAGFICAPATGSYTFWVAADDNTELWLSTDNEPVNKQKIAYHTSWTNPRQWNKFVTQKSVPVYLTQGQSYYIEALMKDGNGPDNLAVGWLKPNETGSVPSEVVPGSVLSPLGVKSANIAAINPATPGIGTKLTVYPNPLYGNELNIKVENMSSEAVLDIYSISGVKCYQELIQNSGTIQIDRRVFKKGVYLIKLQNEYSIKTMKLVVE